MIGSDLGLCDAYATAALANGAAGVRWLSSLDDYQFAAIADNGECLLSAGFPGTL